MKDENLADDQTSMLLGLTADVVAAYVGNNEVAVDELPGVVVSVHATLMDLRSDNNGTSDPQKPAVSVKKSITDEYIICLEDGKKLKMLKRYLRTHYNLSPEEYRRKWGLPADYPMVAPNYAKKRSAFAKKIGLGKSRGK